MAINPVGSGNNAAAGAQRAGGAARGKETGVAGSNGDASLIDGSDADQLQLSDAATTGTSDSNIPTDALSPDALRVIAQRLADGSYNSSAVADRIAGKLLSGGEI